MIELAIWFPPCGIWRLAAGWHWPAEVKDAFSAFQVDRSIGRHLFCTYRFRGDGRSGRKCGVGPSLAKGSVADGSVKDGLGRSGLAGNLDRRIGYAAAARRQVGSAGV